MRAVWYKFIDVSEERNDSSFLYPYQVFLTGFIMLAAWLTFTLNLKKEQLISFETSKNF
jgi:hypothetical protein